MLAAWAGGVVMGRGGRGGEAMEEMRVAAGQPQASSTLTATALGSGIFTSRGSSPVSSQVAGPIEDPGSTPGPPLSSRSCRPAARALRGKSTWPVQVPSGLYCKRSALWVSHCPRAAVLPPTASQCPAGRALPGTVNWQRTLAVLMAVAAGRPHSMTTQTSAQPPSTCSWRVPPSSHSTTTTGGGTATPPLSPSPPPLLASGPGCGWGVPLLLLLLLLLPTPTPLALVFKLRVFRVMEEAVVVKRVMGVRARPPPLPFPLPWLAGCFVGEEATRPAEGRGSEGEGAAGPRVGCVGALPSTTTSLASRGRPPGRQAVATQE
ncbi:hypothetical protein V8C86DRAFT_2547113 [Haematococcus lacustris]